MTTRPLFLLVLAALVEGIMASNMLSTTSFQAFVSQYNRDFEPGSEEYLRRQALFHKRLAAVKQHNAQPNRLWTAAISSLSDRTPEELRRLRGWRRSSDASAESGPTSFLALDQRRNHHRPPAKKIDWRHLQALQDVPNQGPCGSCWAVTAATLLGAHHEIHRGAARNFSAQHLVNCVQNPHKCGGAGGCDGATVELALKFAVNRGVPDDSKVPYMGTDDTCQEGRRSLLRVGIHTEAKRMGLVGFNTLPENRAWPLMQALADGPVGISAAASEWSLYGNGVFDGCAQDAEIDHAVVLVGYGHDPVQGVNYWTIRNSWGSGWGEDGFIRLFRHATAHEDDTFCGIDHDPKAGTACEPYPTSVRVCGMCGLLYDSAAPRFEPAAPAPISSAQVASASAATVGSGAIHAAKPKHAAKQHAVKHAQPKRHFKQAAAKAKAHPWRQRRTRKAMRR